MASLIDLYSTLLPDAEFEYLGSRLGTHATDLLILGTSTYTDSVLGNNMLMSTVQGSHHKQMIQKACSI